MPEEKDIADAMQKLNDAEYELNRFIRFTNMCGRNGGVDPMGVNVAKYQDSQIQKYQECITTAREELEELMRE